MNGNSHPWSSDPEGQAAIRRAEPDRGPTLAHHEVPAMVEKLGAALVATHTSLSKVDRAIALALEGVANRVARLEGWIDNRRAANGGATSVADAYAVAARQAEAAARDHTSTFVMPDPMRPAPVQITEGDELATVRDGGGRPMPKRPPPGLVTPPTTKAATVENTGGGANHQGSLDSSPQPPRGWLTEEERKCLTFLLDSVCVSRETDECIKALLARSTPPLVKLPPEIAGMVYDAVSVRNAIRAAGVEVTS